MKPGRLLDIGAQKGEFLWEMRRLGWQVQGVELDASIPNPAVLPIRYGDFLSMDFAPSSFDCITFWAVLEHVYHPARFLERAASLLRPGGRLVALVTNLNSIQARFHRADDFPRHLTVFTSRSVQYLCETNGLRVTRLHTGQEIFGGALNGGLVYFAKRLAGYSEDEAFREWKQSSDPDLFWVKWRGRPSRVMRGISRVDRALTLPLEWLLDRLGFGFILTFAAIKDDRLWKSE
jgi:SAM-dependent methyltransferase